MGFRPAPSAALLLTAGLGTRLRPLTAALAKPALPVAGPTLVERIVAKVRDAGVADLLLNLHYLPATITAVVGEGAALGVRVRYSWEVPLLGSGGGPRRAFALLPDDRLWLVNGDTLTDLDFTRMADEHAHTGALVTMAVIPNPAPERYGGVVVDASGDITAFVPRGTAEPTWHFIGVQIAERAAFAGLADGTPAESVTGVYRTLMAGGPGIVRAFRTDAAFHDIGTPRDYLAACLRLAGASLVAGPRAHVHRSASVGEVVLWADAVVGAGATLERVVVTGGVRVPEGFRARDAVLAAGADGLLVTPFT